MLYDKNSESHFFSPPPKSEYFFQHHWESEYFFRKKPYPPPPFQVKWLFPYDVFFYVFLGKSMDRTFLSVGSPFIEEGGKMPQSHSIAVLSFFFLCFFFIYFVFFQLYMYLFGYDFNNLKQGQAEYFFFIEILTSVLTIQSYLFLSLNFSQRNSLYVLTVIYHEIISVFPYSDGRCAIFKKCWK